MEKYGVELVRPWLSNLKKIDDGGVIVAFPRAGVNRILSDCAEVMPEMAGWGGIDVNDFGMNLGHLKESLDLLAKQAIVGGGRFILVSGLNLDKKLAEKRIELLKQVRLANAKKINYIIALHVDPRIEKRPWVDKYYDLLLSNILYIPYASDKRWEQLKIQNEARFEFEMGNDAIKILRLSGGCPYLVKFLSKRKAEGKEVEVNEETVAWAKSILQALPGRWLSWLKNLDKTDEIKIKMLRELEVVDESGRIRSELIEKALSDLNYNPVLKVVENKLWVDGQDKSNLFGVNEIQILEKLLSESKLKREEVAKICWGENGFREYSEYALDKIMSNLRTKMVKEGFDKEFITTVKGVGYEIKND